MKKLKLRKNTIRLLAGAGLANAVGGVYTGGDSTVVFTNCESQTCSVGCPGSANCSANCTMSCQRPTCTDPWPPPPN